MRPILWIIVRLRFLLGFFLVSANPIGMQYAPPKSPTQRPRAHPMGSSSSAARQPWYSCM
jgi:hypothetical protein